MNLDIDVARLGVIFVLALMAGWWDWRERRIPNWLCLGGLAAALMLNEIPFALKGLGLALAIHLPLFALRATGGGDVKLMAALGALMGVDDWLRFFILNAVLGGVVALGFVLSRGVVGETVKRVGFVLSSLLRGKAPYESRPELDVRSGLGRTLPRGVVVAFAVVVWAVWVR